MYSLVITNGLVFDGSGSPGFPADVAVSADRVVRVGKIEDEAAKVIDATGMIVSPGFIDIHGHSDSELLIDPEGHSKVKQGVTTEIVGNCGGSAVLKAGNEEQGRSWPDFGRYFGALETQGIALNVAAMIGHGSIRSAVMGHERRAPNPDELARMKRLIAEALEQGAVGFSTGLIYAPGSFAEPDEINQLCREVERYDGMYATHLRGEGDTLIEAVEEAITNARASGVRTEISHHKAMGTQNWGKVNDTLAMIDSANQAGCEITVDTYSYVAGSSNMASLLPPWVHDGGRQALVSRLADRRVRTRLRSEMVDGLPNWSGRLRGTGWENIMIVSFQENPSLEGKRVSQIAEESGKDPFDTCFDMLNEAGGRVKMCIFSTCEADVETVMRSPLSMIGSDGRALRAEGPLSKGKPHPRNYGNYPRVLSEYVRARGVIDMATAIRKMTAIPAWKAGLKGRGTIAEGARADLVVFDPAEIRDTATFANPHSYPVGIDYVIINGTVVVDHGTHTGALPGMVLRRQG